MSATEKRFSAAYRRPLRATVCILAALMTSAAIPAFSADEDKDFEKAVEAYQEKDYETALKRFKKSAEKGSVEAMYNVAVFYTNGFGVKEDEAEAFQWFLKAAEKGYARAQYAVSVRYDFGNGVPRNNEEAFKWLKKAAEQKYPDALYVVGRAYRLGLNTEKNPEEAVKLLEEASEKGNTDACLDLGLMYQNGEGGLKPDDRTVFRLFKTAADNGNSEAAYHLAECYVLDKGVDSSEFQTGLVGFGGGYAQQAPGARPYTSKQLLEKASPLYKKAADDGVSDAKLKYYLCSRDKKYLEDAVKSGSPEAIFYYYLASSIQDETLKSSSFFKHVAESEDADPQELYWLGVLFYYPCQNVNEADKWLTKAAEKGYAPAQDYLGQKFEFGGVLWTQIAVGDGYYSISEKKCEKNEEEAAKWYAKAAEQGYLLAQYHLARCYEKGVGVEESDEDAIKWYRKALGTHWNLLDNKFKHVYFLDHNHRPYEVGDVKADAAFKLGRYYEKGWGVERNLESAVNWYRRSTAEKDFWGGLSNDKDAKEALKRLGY